MKKIIKYVIIDILQHKIIIAYTIFLFLVSSLLLGMESNSLRGIMSLLNIVLIVIPLVSIIFSAIHFYNSYEFIELLLAQPINRTRILLSEYFGVMLSLVFAFLIGVGVPFFIFSISVSGISLLITGTILTAVFVSLAFLASVFTRDKAKGIGLSLLLWFYFSLIYDGIVLSILYSFNDYPLEKPMLLLVSLNPVDLARVIMMLQMDISALMGYTGAIFKEFFGSFIGITLSLLVLLVWVVLPIWWSSRIFSKKDL